MPTILVADDDPDICALLDFKLSAGGYDVLVEHDGEAALAAARAQHVDLVVLDWMMPRLGGVEVCQAMRADARLARVPVLLLTARTQEADVQQGLANGADDYIVKPFSPREVAARVAAALARAAR